MLELAPPLAARSTPHDPLSTPQPRHPTAEAAKHRAPKPFNKHTHTHTLGRVMVKRLLNDVITVDLLSLRPQQSMHICDTRQGLTIVP